MELSFENFPMKLLIRVTSFDSFSKQAPRGVDCGQSHPGDETNCGGYWTGTRH